MSWLALVTVAVFVTLGNAAPVAATVSAMGGNELPGSSIGGCVQVTVCPAAPQTQTGADAANVRETRGQRIRHDDGVVFALEAGRVRNGQRVDVAAADREVADVRLRQREVDDGLARRADDLRGQENEVAAGRVLRRRRRLTRRKKRRDVERVDVDAIARRDSGRVDGTVVRLDHGVAARDDDAIVDGRAVEAQHLAEAVQWRRVTGVAFPRDDGEAAVEVRRRYPEAVRIQRHIVAAKEFQAVEHVDCAQSLVRAAVDRDDTPTRHDAAAGAVRRAGRHRETRERQRAVAGDAVRDVGEAAEVRQECAAIVIRRGERALRRNGLTVQRDVRVDGPGAAPVEIRGDDRCARRNARERLRARVTDRARVAGIRLRAQRTTSRDEVDRSREPRKSGDRRLRRRRERHER
jgi:hypothetical protein